MGPRQEIEHDRLVIALEEMGVEASRQRAKQQLHHAPAVRPAIDVVADEDEASPPHADAFRRIGRDLREQRGEQVRPAVNIADGVDKLARRQGGMVQGVKTICVKCVLETILSQSRARSPSASLASDIVAIAEDVAVELGGKAEDRGHAFRPEPNEQNHLAVAKLVVLGDDVKLVGVERG